MEFEIHYKNISGLLIARPGAFTTVQDGGRPGFRAWGVPWGGAADRASLGLANALVGNPPDAAALELTSLGGAFEATAPLWLALAGAPMAAEVDREAGPTLRLMPPLSFGLGPGDRLRLGGCARGIRAYLAVRGGWRTDMVLGSRSSETPLRAGQVVPANPSDRRTMRRLPADPSDVDEGLVRVMDGPDVAVLGDAFRWDDSGGVALPESDRMGLRLGGLPAIRPAEGRRSTPVAPGTIQAAGPQWIILGVAGGTMGGYPHVGQVIAADLDRLARVRPGSPVRFRKVGREEARAADRERREALRRLWLRVRTASADGP